MNVDKAQLAEAASYLVHVREYVSQIKELETIIAEWGTRHVKYVGERECLNALINLGLQDPEKLRKLYNIIEAKRKEVPDAKRNDYQREFMAKMRARVSKALQIEAIIEGRSLSAAERKEREKRIHAEWMKRKSDFISTKGPLDWKGRNAATQEYWGLVDTELERLLSEAKAQLEHPPMHRKRKVDVLPKPPANPQMYEQLKKIRKGA